MLHWLREVICHRGDTSCVSYSRSGEVGWTQLLYIRGLEVRVARFKYIGPSPPPGRTEWQSVSSSEIVNFL